jgi:hypothetical protein
MSRYNFFCCLLLTRTTGIRTGQKDLRSIRRLPASLEIGSSKQVLNKLGLSLSKVLEQSSTTEFSRRLFPSMVHAHYRMATHSAASHRRHREGWRSPWLKNGSASRMKCWARYALDLFSLVTLPHSLMSHSSRSSDAHLLSPHALFYSCIITRN